MDHEYPYFGSDELFDDEPDDVPYYEDPEELDRLIEEELGTPKRPHRRRK